jgi:FHA domain
MWVIRFYTGPLMGKQLPLKMGRNLVGRGTHCDVSVPSQNMSKEHATIEMYNDKIIVSDLKSSNGTFVNGIQISKSRLQPGDKIAFHDVLADVVERIPKKKAPTARNFSSGPSYDGNVAYKQNYNPELFNQPAAGPVAPNFMAYVQRYLDEVVLPGVYKLAELVEFRLLLALFVTGFIVFVTALSTIPLMRILKASIERESQRRAMTIAHNLALINRAPLIQGLQSSLTTESATREPGVDRAYVISGTNGEILAPLQNVGTAIVDIPYIQEGRKIRQESFEQTDDNMIVAMVPITTYNSTTGAEAIPAYSVVVYNMGALAIDNSRTLSLFVQILFIAIIVGGILYFFLYKVIQRPLILLNDQINVAMRDGTTQVATTYQFAELHTLASSINGAIHRGAGGFAGDNIKATEADRSIEMQNVVNLIGFAALTVSPADRTLTAINDHFLNQIGQNQNWVGITIDKILDQALKLNLQGLIDKVVAAPTQIATDQLEIASQNFSISAQSIYGTTQVAYIVVVFVPSGGA